MARMTREQLIALARQIVDREGGQVAAASVLGIAQATISKAIDLLIEGGLLIEEEGELRQRSYDPPPPPMAREALSEAVPIHRRPDSTFTYDIESWQTDSDRALREWYKKEAAARGLDWKEQLRAHKERMRELKKPPGLRHREAP